MLFILRPILKYWFFYGISKKLGNIYRKFYIFRLGDSTMITSSFRNESELLQKIAKGDQLAFRSVYNLYSKKTYLFACRILNSDVLAEEVMQETMLKIWLLGDELNGIRNLDAYLRKISRNICYNVLRRNKLELQTDVVLSRDWVEVHNETEEQILLNDTNRVLQDGIALLPQQQRLVFQMCHQQGLKYDEVARQLNLSPLSVQTYMKLALRFLRKYVAEHTDLVIALIILKLI